MMSRPFEPSDDQRRMVRKLAGLGLPQAAIAGIVGIAETTLRRACRTELDEGSAAATAQVAQTLFKMATSGENTAATIFWMKARARWSERVQHDVRFENVPAHAASDDALTAIALGGSIAGPETEADTDEPEGMVH
jgi:hypothetical protein